MLSHKFFKYTVPPTVFATVVLSALFMITFASAQAITRGYFSDDAGLQPGMLVRLSDQTNPEAPKVERATVEHADQIIGIATTVSESSVTIASGEQSVYVETTGEVNAYVSDIYGEVNKGDLLIASPFSGILAKYTSGKATIYGLALEDSNSKPSESYDIQNPDGKGTTNLTTIKINLDQKGVENGAKELNTLEKLGRSVTGKEVNQLRIVVALVIFIIVLIVEGAMLYGSISSAITSIGRNPLAGKVIRRELIKIIAVALVVMLIGVGSIYLVLWV